MVKAAKIAYEKYPTVVNDVPESKSSYNNTLEKKKKMDSLMQLGKAIRHIRIRWLNMQRWILPQTAPRWV